MQRFINKWWSVIDCIPNPGCHRFKYGIVIRFISSSSFFLFLFLSWYLFFPCLFVLIINRRSSLFVICKSHDNSFTLSTSVFMFHLISFNPHFTDMFHFYFIHSIVHLMYFIYYSPSHSYFLYLVALILHGYSNLLSVSLFS